MTRESPWRAGLPWRALPRIALFNGGAGTGPAHWEWLDQRTKLNLRPARHWAPYMEVVRARIVLMAADGMQNAGLVQPVQVVSNWSKRIYAENLDGLVDRLRLRRP